MKSLRNFFEQTDFSEDCKNIFYSKETITYFIFSMFSILKQFSPHRKVKIALLQSKLYSKRSIFLSLTSYQLITSLSWKLRNSSKNFLSMYELQIYNKNLLKVILKNIVRKWVNRVEFVTFVNFVNWCFYKLSLLFIISAKTVCLSSWEFRKGALV